MKKLLVFISLMLSFLCTEAKPLFLEKNELLDLKSRVLFDDAMPSKLLYPYAIHDAKIIKIPLRKLAPIECKIIE